METAYVSRRLCTLGTLRADLQSSAAGPVAAPGSSWLNLRQEAEERRVAA
jgi:hypothetical protein